MIIIYGNVSIERTLSKGHLSKKGVCTDRSDVYMGTGCIATAQAFLVIAYL